jgi:hypothetical protein
LHPPLGTISLKRTPACTWWRFSPTENGYIRRQIGIARSIDILVSPQDLPILDWLELVKSSVRSY